MDNTRLFQSFTAVAGTVWIRLPANLQAFGRADGLVLYWGSGSVILGIKWDQPVDTDGKTPSTTLLIARGQGFLNIGAGRLSIARFLRLRIEPILRESKVSWKYWNLDRPIHTSQPPRNLH